MNQENERSRLISKLSDSLESRTAYIKAKLGILVPSQVRALRRQSNMPRQKDLAEAANLHQSRISMFETPGMANLTLETLAKLGAAFGVGVIVQFVSFSDMLRWENEFSQDAFYVTKIDQDEEFLDPDMAAREPEGSSARKMDVNDLARSGKKPQTSVQKEEDKEMYQLAETGRKPPDNTDIANDPRMLAASGGAR